MLFPKAGWALPTLFDAVSSRPFETVWEEWGPDAQRLWGYKDELPLKGLAWYGRFVRGSTSFLAPDLLADLYPRAGRPDDFRDAELSGDAHRVAAVILASGPTSRAVLREATGLEGKAGNAAFQRALGELGRALVVTHHGTADEGGAWPSAVLELTARAFRVTSKRPAAERRRRAARRFLRTVVGARPADLSRAFAWDLDGARAALDDLVASREARREGPLYLISPER